RKWRPQTFDTVVGQEHVTRTLRNAIASGRVAHAFLFTGPRGVGKTTTARLLAKALNCEQGPTADACNTCGNCTEITAGHSLDVLEIDGASHTGVDNIRDLTEGIQYRPVKSRFRIIIIDEVHMLSNAAFNALLKTLEEPPAHVKFIFATTESQKILPTIASRCQRYDFKRIALRELMQKLKSIAEQEGLTTDDVGLALLAREADGSLRDAESLLDQVVAWSDGKVTEQTVRASLGVADRQALLRVVDAILARDAATALRLAGDLYEHGYDPRRLCHDLLEHFRNVAMMKVNAELAALTDLPDHEIAVVQRQAATRSLEDVQRLFQLTLRAEEDMQKTAYSQLVVEMTLVKLASQPAIVPIENALAQLDALTRALNGQSQGQSPQVAPTAQPARQASPSVAPSRPSIPSSPPEPPPPARPAPPLQPVQHATIPNDRQEAQEPRVQEQVKSLNSDEQPVWESFLTAIQKEKISLFFALKSGRLLELTDTSLLIGMDKDPYYKELVRKENITLLEATAKRLLGRSVTVQIKKGGTVVSPSVVTSPTAVPFSRPQPVAQSRNTTAQPSAEPQQKPPTEADPLVKTVLDVLGGEVQATLSHRDRGSSEPPREEAERSQYGEHE
ncbi:MAG: DNA polymerase III subunit gamma/tau, partial [Deltaproteobacteria bacterium]|nr:DNA polymerase III subunit gamma/tau [Deltaproteobacteria bacterium]